MTKARLVAALFLTACASTLHAGDYLDSIPAYCATFPTDSSYKVHLIRHTKDFNNSCGCSDHNKKSESHINFPRDLGKRIHPSDTYYLANAKRVLPEFYGQTFRGSKSETECKGNTFKRKEQEFDILLVGPCLKTIPAAHYCAIKGEKPTLYLTDTFGNRPRVYLFDSTKASLLEDFQQEIRCSGTSRTHNKIVWDFPGIGQFKLGSFLEEDTCHAQSKWNNYNKAELPKYVDFSSDTTFSITTSQLKKLYGKNIAVAWDISMECGFKRDAHHVEYEVLLTGECPADVKIDPKKADKLDLWRLYEVDLHVSDRSDLDIDDYDQSEACIVRRKLK